MMYYDLMLDVTPAMVSDANGNDRYSFTGHLGTHFDVMDREFPLEDLERPAIVFDVSHIRGRDIDENDIDLSRVGEGMFVAFYTGYIEEFGYGKKAYFHDHIQLSPALIEALLGKDVRMIGIDCAGIRHGREHTPIDQHCADHGVFVVENLCGLGRLLEGERSLASSIPTPSASAE